MPENSHRCQMVLVAPWANRRGGRMDGGRDSANPSPPLRTGSPGQCRESRAGETHLIALASSDCRRCPSREGIHFATGRTCWCWGTGRGVLFQLTTLPPHSGGPYKATRTSGKGCPGLQCRGQTPREGALDASPPRGEGSEIILRGNGVLGEEAGVLPWELFVHWTMGTPKWGTGMGRRLPQGRR